MYFNVTCHTGMQCRGHCRAQCLLVWQQHKEQLSVIHFLRAKRLFTNAIHSEMRPVYGDKCFTRPAIHVWYVRSLLVDEKVSLMKKDLADVLFQRLMQRSQQSRLLHGLTGVIVNNRDCNPGLEFSIPGFGIVEFPIPGSRRD